MPHLDTGSDFTTSASEIRQLAPIARHTAFRDSTFSNAVQLLERRLGRGAGELDPGWTGMSRGDPGHRASVSPRQPLG